MRWNHRSHDTPVRAGQAEDCLPTPALPDVQQQQDVLFSLECVEFEFLKQRIPRSTQHPMSRPTKKIMNRIAIAFQHVDRAAEPVVLPCPSPEASASPRDVALLRTEESLAAGRGRGSRVVTAGGGCGVVLLGPVGVLELVPVDDELDITSIVPGSQAVCVVKVVTRLVQLAASPSRLTAVKVTLPR